MFGKLGIISQDDWVFFFKNISGIIQVYLVCGFNHLEKYESMGRIIPYMKWKIKNE
jgi:hypothetical protein